MPKRLHLRWSESLLKMNEQELKLKLKEMKQELLNLKIAHERGLGIASFYEAEASVVTDTSHYGRAWYNVVIEFPGLVYSESSPFFIFEAPFSTAYINGGLTLEYEDYRETFVEIDYGGDTHYPAVFKCKIVSTLPITKFELKNVGD